MVDAQSAPLPTADQVRAALAYDPITGALTWRRRSNASRQWNTRYFDKEAGCLNAKGYVSVALSGRRFLAHRLIWLMVTGSWPTGLIDHVNCDKTDNRLSNLRAATCSQNLSNCGLSSANTSGFRGVSRCKSTGLWRAKIKVTGKHICLGRYVDLISAHRAYSLAAERYFGEFASGA